MYDKGKVLLGIAIFLLLVLTPVWYAAARGGPAERPELNLGTDAKACVRDSEYMRLLDSGAARPFSVKNTKELLEKDLEKDSPDLYMFLIKTLQDERLIGTIALDGVQDHHGDAFVSIGIGERQYWNQGYGTDAMRVILNYAFNELSLDRVSLNVFAYNSRAIRAYEKAGFKHEGCQREVLHRDGRRWDILYMGILRSEWVL